MRYIVCPRSVAESKGLQLAHHTMDDESVVLNEKEVMNSPILEGNTLEDKAADLDGEVCSLAEVKHRFLM